MKMQFRHNGRQFFFITLTLEGRVKVLSRLETTGGEPVLTHAGETVLAYLKALHAVWPCVTVSNRVIMPDHIHFLMMVNYDLAPDFNPLWASFILMDAIEVAWTRTNGGLLPPEPPASAVKDCGVMLSPPEPPEKALKRFIAIGQIAAGEINALMYERKITRDEALAELCKRGGVITRDGGIQSARQNFTVPMQSGSQTCGGAMQCGLQRSGGVMQGARGEQPPVRSGIHFNRRVYIELSFNSCQLKTIRRYIKLNPARAIWKASHPDRFIRFANIRHAVLDQKRTWDAMGNLTLLGSPFLFHVRLTLKKSLIEHEAAICEIVEKARRGMVPVSGFISPGEVEVLRRLKAASGTRFIKLLPCAMPPRYDPSAEDSRELATERMLILSGFRNTNHISALSMRRDPAQAHLFRANCLAMNDIGSKLCARAQSLF